MREIKHGDDDDDDDDDDDLTFLQRETSPSTQNNHILGRYDKSNLNDSARQGLMAAIGD